MPKCEFLHDVLVFRNACKVTAKSFIVSIHLSALNNLAYTTKYTNLKLKYRKKNYYKKMSTGWHIVTSLLLKPLKQRLVDVTSFKIFKLLYSRSVLFKCTKSFGPVFPNGLDRGIYETKLLTQVSFHFSIFYLSYHFNFPFDARNLFFLIRHCSSVITLPISC